MLSPAATESTVSLIVHKGVSPDASFRRPDARLTLSICKRRAKPSRACQDHTGRDRQGRNDNRLCRPDPPDHGKNPRPVVKVKAGDPIKINWMLTNVYPHKTLENVVVHFYVAREEKVGQKPTPDLGVEANVVMESAFEMDFKPGAKAGVRNTLKIDKPGVYLIRVESKQTQTDHEHFAAIDLVVEDRQ
jgi:hypothetical protein